MRIDSRPGAAHITLDDRRHELPAPLEQACAWPGRQLVVVLLAPGAGPRRLLLLGPEGDARALDPPAGLAFYYLEPLPDRVTVVCTGDVPIDGWQDWRYAIVPGRGELERIGPSK
jgi:hypothetical protein